MTDSTNSPLYPFNEVPPRTFETERLRLRTPEISDLDLVFKSYTSDPVATKYMAWPRAVIPEDGRAFLETVHASFAGRPNGPMSFSWLIQIKETGELIGACGIGAQTGSTVDGGYILSPAFWGKGYAAEAWKPVVEWAKTQPDIQRIEAGHHPDNPASGAVMRKVGLTFDQVTEAGGQYPNLEGGSRESVVYAWVRP
jgi:ribosomal-protein-alanine N-acetyltransferase